MDYELVVQQKKTMVITEEKRDEICRKMSRAMGRYLQLKNKPWSQWTKDDWQDFILVAFDHCAPDVALLAFNVEDSIQKPFEEHEMPY